MTNYGFTGNTISKKLDTKTIQNGGLELITMPIAHCNFSDIGKVEIGGYKSLVHYNKDRENQFKQDKSNRSMRRIKKSIKNKKLRNSGETLPFLIIQTCVKGAVDS